MNKQYQNLQEKYKILFLENQEIKKKLNELEKKLNENSKYDLMRSKNSFYNHILNPEEERKNIK